MTRPNATCQSVLPPPINASMNSFKRLLFAFLLVAFGAILGGCTNKTEKDSSIPWSRPADWEGQIPGMGQGR